MFIGSTLCVLVLVLVLVLMELLSVDSQALFEVAAIDFTVDTVATQHVLAHRVTDPCPVLNTLTR